MYSNALEHAGMIKSKSLRKNSEHNAETSAKTCYTANMPSNVFDHAITRHRAWLLYKRLTHRMRSLLYAWL